MTRAPRVRVDEAGAPRIALVVVALGTIPLFFVLLPILAPILATVLAFTTLMLTSDSGNLQMNALLPWFVLGFAIAPFVIVYLGSARAFGRLRGR